MFSYKENPNLPHEIVTTFDGEKEYRANCKKIRDNYYVPNVSCFPVNGRWYRIDSGLIQKDFETNTYFLNNEPMYRINGLVGFKGGKPELGLFTPNPYNNVSYQSGMGYGTALNSDVLAENGYIEDISTGVWLNKATLGLVRVKEATKIKNTINHCTKGYNIEDNSAEAALKTKYYNEYDMPLGKDVRRYSRMLNDASFGLEIECSHGYIPDNLQNRSGIVICRDGSLPDEHGNIGPEFTTIPLRGAKGLQNIVNISNELKKRTLINSKCSLHIHIGNLPVSRLFLVSLYVLGFKIQDELYKMFPYYKTDFETANKEKDYCKKLKKMSMGVMKVSSKEDYDRYVNDNYNKLFYWLSQNQNGSGYNAGPEYNSKRKLHPVSQKWNRKNRYYWLNLMNIMFSERNTVEFRLHTPTVNSQKIINWLFICNAIVRYASLNSKDILTSNKKISLDNVLDYYKDSFRAPQATLLSEYLKAYVGERTKAFQNDFVAGDYLSKWEMDGDKDYEFKYGNITHLF